MRLSFRLWFTLAFCAAGAHAQGSAADAQIAQVLLTEIRELRQDLRNTAGTIQRIQIVMYRHQAQAGALEKATQRLDLARNVCKQTQQQQKRMAAQIEKAEERKRDSQDPTEKVAAEQMMVNFQETMEMFTTQAQECQAEQVDAENQLRTEQAKMNELDDQLNQLDQILTGRGTK